MKKFNKIMSLLLALVLVLGLAACGGNTDGKADPTTGKTDATTGNDNNEVAEYVNPYADLVDDYDALSEAVYNDVYGEFYAAYQTALEATTVTERYALMAIAEAKLLETGVMIPLTSQGGNYGVSRLAPYSASTIGWGLDSDRYHNVIVATEPLTATVRDELKALWAELKGTGTYEAEARALLESKGYTLKDTYTMGYSSDPKTWDLLATSRSADSEAILNTVDLLAEYDMENVLQPMLAESWECSEDGLTWTFNIRQGVKWVDSQGREIAELTADDFVAGFQHMLDAAEGLEALVTMITNVNEYVTGEVTDFNEVGVKAVDTYTLQYTLSEPCLYFETMLTYNPFAPLCRSYYVSKGGQFGADYDNSADSYTYGKTPDDIAYCGPYVVSNYTSENTIVFSSNNSYWNKDNVTIKTITWLYNDGEDALMAYNQTLSGVQDGAGLNSSAVEAAKADGLFDQDLVYTVGTNSTSYVAFMNVYRGAFANFNDEAAATSKTEEDIERTQAAMLNAEFRLALCQALDRGSYVAQIKGEELKYASMINSYIPGNFVQMAEDVTIDINGAATTFTAGTYYGAIVQAQLDADGLDVTVWDPTAEAGLGSSTQFDGWYNVDAAVEHLNKAIEELAAQGIEVSAENPIYVDIPCWTTSESYANRGQATKKSIESALGGAVIINLVECVDSTTWYYAGYYCDFGNEGNYDIYDVSGWGPDYGDPSTFLDTFLPDYAGYMVKMTGIY